MLKCETQQLCFLQNAALSLSRGIESNEVFEKKEDIGNLENTTYMPNKDQEYMLPWKMVDTKQSYNDRKKSAIYL